MDSKTNKYPPSESYDSRFSKRMIQVASTRASTSITWSSKSIARIKRLVKLGMGFFSFESAWNTLQGYEVMNMVRKGQMRGVGKGEFLRQIEFIASLFGVAA